MLSTLANSVRRYVTFPTYVCTYILSYITWLTYPSSYDLTSFIVLTSSRSSYRSRLSNWYTYITRSVTLSPSSLALSSKILPISRLSTKGTVSSSLICCSPFLMPPLLASMRRAAFVVLILSISEVMPFCSHCIKKGLVCITIAALFGR